MKEVEFFDRDFLDNKIEIGDKVIFETPGYRSFVIGTVITKAPKSCQVEYINDWNYPREGGVLEVVRQCYGQVIKYPIKEGKWVQSEEWAEDYTCSVCGNTAHKDDHGNYNSLSKYCPHCGVKMEDVK